jgi:hypothetical protein
MPAEVSDLSQAANLDGLRLVTGGIDLRNAGPEVISEFDLNIETGAGKPPEAPGKLLTKFGLRVNLRATGAKAVLGNMFVEYGLVYSVRQPDYDALTDELALAFSIFASPIHSWPHAREFLLNLSWRTQLVNIVLPSFKQEMFPDFFAQGHKYVEQHRALVQKTAGR